MHPGRIILIGWVIYALLLAIALARRAPRAKKKIPRKLEGPLRLLIVRPSVLTDGPARGSYRHGPNVGSYVLPTKISRADVADFMLKQLHDDTCVGAAPGLCY